MTVSIPVSLVQGWITELQAILKEAAQEPKPQADHWINKGMRHGLDQITSRLDTWLRHQESMKTLARSGQRLLITKDVDLSDGRYRKLEWYQDDLFLTLAWRHARDAHAGELMLEIQQVRDLSKTYLVHTGNSSFDDLAEVGREGGLDSIRNDKNRQAWAEKVWT